MLLLKKINYEDIDKEYEAIIKFHIMKTGLKINIIMFQKKNLKMKLFQNY